MYLWIDVDCFECQVWSQLYPELRNGPLIIIGSSSEQIFSYDYQAKSHGISREDTVESAKVKCPSLIVYTNTNSNTEIPRARERIQRSIKNSISETVGNKIQFHWGFDDGYINVGMAVDFQITHGFRYFEENSWSKNTKWITSSYTQETSGQSSEDVCRLQIGANILAGILRRLQLDTGFFASGGVGVTKTIARLVCPLNKPQGITVVTTFGLKPLLALVKIKSAPGFKGKTGEKILSKFKKPDGTNLETLQDLRQHVPFKDLSDAGYVDRSNADARDLICLLYFD